MHAIRLEHAFAYSQAGNGSGVSSSKALGSSAVKIAVIDTGEDSTHPELSKKIVYQKCFITNSSGAQSTSNFATDLLGHGTDVSGLAAADTGNGFGFSGTGGNVVLYGYRVFPTPDDNCANPNSPDPQCGTDDRDVVSALSDATAQHVNVINLSLGGGGCASAGTDPDPLEGAAIQDAIAANIVVVAASGNDSKPGSIAPLEAPACDTGSDRGGSDQSGGRSAERCGQFETAARQIRSSTSRPIRTPARPAQLPAARPPGASSRLEATQQRPKAQRGQPYRRPSLDRQYLDVDAVLSLRRAIRLSPDCATTTIRLLPRRRRSTAKSRSPGHRCRLRTSPARRRSSYRSIPRIRARPR